MEDDSVLDTNMQTMSMKQLNLSSAVAISTNPQTLCLLGWKRNIWLLALVWVQVLAAEFARADLYVSLAAEKANYSALENMGPFTSYVTIKDNIQSPVMITSITSSGPVFMNGDRNDALSSVNLVNPPAVPFSLPPECCEQFVATF